MLPKKLLKSFAKKMSVEAGEPRTLADAEVEILDKIERVARSVAANSRNAIAYYDPYDIAQEMRYECLVLIGKGTYDVSKPLAPYLMTNAKRRLMNLKRKLVFRLESPCRCCDMSEPPQEPCEKFKRWQQDNKSKALLGGGASGWDAEPVPAPVGPDHFELFEAIESFVKQNLPKSVHRDFLALRDGKEISEARSNAVLRPILLAFRKEVANG